MLLEADARVRVGQTRLAQVRAIEQCRAGVARLGEVLDQEPRVVRGQG